MTKQEFLQELRLALQGQLSQTAINENVRYYDNYIMEEIRKGSSEEDVISHLGNPRLIAKTLIDTTDSFGKAAGSGYYSGGYGRAESGRVNPMNDLGNTEYGNMRRNSWYGKLFLLTVVAILVIIIIANVIAFLLPILVPVIIVFLIYSLFFGNRR